MEPFPDLSTLSDDALSDLLRSLDAEEDAISRRRKALHGSIDVLRVERIARLRAQVAAGAVDVHTPDSLDRPLYAGTGEASADDDPPALPPDLTTLDDDELRVVIRTLEHEEDDISLRRRFLQGQIDILRAERAKRARSQGGEHVHPDELGAILGGRKAPDGSR